MLRRAWQWRTGAAFVAAALIVAACTGARGAPTGDGSTATVQQRVLDVVAAETGISAGDRSGPPPRIVELDVAAGAAKVEDCVVTPDGTTGVTAVVRRGDDGQWTATRTAPTSRCLPAGLAEAVEGWWQARKQWLAAPDPDHPLLTQHLTGQALDDTRRLLNEWANKGWVGHTAGIMRQPWKVELSGGAIVADACGPGGTMAVGSVGIEDTVTQSWPLRIVFMEGKAERARLTMAWERDGWRVSDTSTPGIAPAAAEYCAQLCPQGEADWCVVKDG